MWEVVPIFYSKEIKLLNLYFSESYLFDLPTICVAQILEGQFYRLFIYIYTHTHTHTEREREREENVEFLQRPFKLLLSTRRQSTHSPARPLTTCITMRRRKKTQRKMRLRSCGKLAALPSENDTTIKDFISCKYVFIMSYDLLCSCVFLLVNFFKEIRRKVRTSSSGSWVRRLTYNLENEGRSLLRNVGKKLPDITAQQPCLCITLWIPQVTVLVLFRTYLFLFL